MILHSIYALYFNGCFRCSFFSVSSSFSFSLLWHTISPPLFAKYSLVLYILNGKDKQRKKEIEKNKRHTHSISITITITISIQQQIVCIYKKSKLSSNVGSTTLAIRNTALRLREKKADEKKDTATTLFNQSNNTNTHTRTKKSMQKK